MPQKFRLASAEEVKKITMTSTKKSSDPDPVPNWLLKKCIDQLLPVITAIISKSVTESAMPSCLKPATIMPLLDKSGLQKEDVKNY